MKLIQVCLARARGLRFWRIVIRERTVDLFHLDPLFPNQLLTYVGPQSDSLIQFKMLARYEDNYETTPILLGQGAFAQVFLAIKKSTRQNVAVKISNRNQISQMEKQIFEKLAQNQPHPNVISIFNVYEQNNALYIVQEYCSGGTLYDLISKKHIFTEESIVNIATQIAKGLQFLHQQNIVHRDIKPENILIQKEASGEIYKITDFGLSSLKNDRMKTVKVGTAYYLAPEILCGCEFYDKTVDIWAFGLIIDELIHGKPFYDGMTEEEVFAKIRVDAPYFIKDPQYAKATVFDHKKFVLKTLLLGTIQRDAKHRKDLEWILNTLAEYYLQSPSSSEQRFQYNFSDISVFSQPLSSDTTQMFQQPIEQEQNLCPFHRLPIKYRMPAYKEDQVAFACQQCLGSNGVFELEDFKAYMLQGYQQMGLISLDQVFNQNQLIIEALKHLDKFHFLKEKERLITDLRNIVCKQQKALKMEISKYLEDLRTHNVNQRWINEALKEPVLQGREVQNKFILFLHKRIQERRKSTIQECQGFIKDQLHALREELNARVEG